MTYSLQHSVEEKRRIVLQHLDALREEVMRADTEVLSCYLDRHAGEQFYDVLHRGDMISPYPSWTLHLSVKRKREKG